MSTDHYKVTNATIKSPPAHLFGKLKFLGPSFILSASIVGSGELIATTTLGAKAGFTAFWVIIVSCLVKVTVQLEFGKHTIIHGETAMEAFNKLPGPKIKSGSWAVWSVLLLTALKQVQIGGIMGSAAIVLHMIFPDLSIVIWTIIIAFMAASLVYKGYYSIVELLSILMITLFTVMTITSLFSLGYTDYNITLPEFLSGLKFNLTPEATTIAIGAFGITGVASDEIIAYNYWCIEKGYAAYTGPREDSDEWRQRAAGWIKVMYLDAIVALVLYTSVTAAFYLLGAAVLNGRGEIPQGNQVIETLANIYTASLGGGIKMAFLVGSFFVLFSSLFSALAAWSRMFSDLFGQLGWIDFRNLAQRKKNIAIIAVVLPSLWAGLFLFIDLPVVMVISGGIVGSILLFLVVYAGWHFHYGRKQYLKSGNTYLFFLWASIISIAFVGIYGILKLISF